MCCRRVRNAIRSASGAVAGGLAICRFQRARNWASQSGCCRSSRVQRPRKSRNSLLMKSRQRASIFVYTSRCNPPNNIDGYLIKCYAFCVTVLKHIEGYNASLIFSSWQNG